MYKSYWDKEQMRIANEAARGYGTPAYIFDMDIFQENVRLLYRAVPAGVRIGYSIKANPWFMKKAVQICDFVEICSPGELALAEDGGIAAQKLVISGPVKNEEEIRKLVSLEPHRISVESLPQLEALNREALHQGKKLSVLLRLSGGNQFGMPKEQVERIYKIKNRYEGVIICGIHGYFGTQADKAETIRERVRKMRDCLTVCGEEAEIELGPGLGVPLFQDRRDDGRFQGCLEALGEELERLRDDCPVSIECGRILAADAGVYCTRIMERRVQGKKIYYLTDGGINHISYYGQRCGSPLPYVIQEDEGREVESCIVCGALCTSADILANEIPLHRGSEGGMLAFQNVGAYSINEGMGLFLSRNLPIVLVMENNEITLFRKAIPTWQFNRRQDIKAFVD